MAKQKYEDQEIVCFPSALLDKIGRWSGFLPGHDWLLQEILECACYKNRADVEEDEDWLQVISYIVLESCGSFFCYERAPTSGEKRLRGKLSIGIGGHAKYRQDDTYDGEPNDGYWMEVLSREAHREVLEEVAILANSDVATGFTVGYLYRDATPVDRVHFGVVEVWELAERKPIQMQDTELSNGEWVTWQKLWENYNNLEGWSQELLCGLPISYDVMNRTSRLL